MASSLVHFWTVLTTLVLLTALSFVPTQAVELADYLPDDVTFDAAIPTPQSVLGYEVGDWHVRYDQLVAYAEAVAAASDRVQTRRVGKTHEQRDILSIVVSSPENLGRLESIRQTHLKLSIAEESDKVDLEGQPVVCFMGYSVHGNESSASNCVPLVLYYLAAAEGEEIERWLSDSVILVDPCMNPDGLSRFGQWANSHKSAFPTGDPSHREHDEVWPGGRTNHYWADLNRDWLLLQHPESQARIEIFHDWRPNVLTDFHEMGSNATFFFQPGVPSRKNPLTPIENVRLTEEIARYHAAAFDEAEGLYYSQERFDDFYYGKGSTFPDIHGAVGILFEQASSRGHRRESINGTFEFPFTIENQFRATLSTLRASIDLREDLLDYQKRFYRDAWREAGRAENKGWIFGDRFDPVRTQRLVELFVRQRIEVYELKKSVTRGEESFEPGSAYVVPRLQPQARLLEAMMETRTAFTDSLFYDVSTWTMPLAMGLPYTELKESSGTYQGERVLDWGHARPGARLTPNAYAYAFSWDGYYAPRALGRLLREDIRCRASTRSFVAATARGEEEFGLGSIVIPMGIQDVPRDEVEALLAKILKEDGVEVVAVTSGWTSRGIDLGSPSLRALKAPKPAILTGNGVSSYNSGAIWHLLDRRFEIELSLIDNLDARSMDLDRYTHIFLPSGRYNAWDSTHVERLKTWVGEGGVLVAVGSSVRFLVNNEIAPISLKSNIDATPGQKRRAYAEASPRNDARRISGAIFQSELDLTHPLAYGYHRRLLPTFRNNSIFMEPSSNPYGTVAQYSASPLLSGYMHSDHDRQVSNAASMISHRVGRGLVVAMTDDPTFRSFWYGPNKLLLNTLFFGQIVSRTGE